MSREIKFRAWSESRKQMVDFGYLQNKESYELLLDRDTNKFFVGGYQENGDWEEPYLMQFTGLKDKNGKEIYEGDVVQFQWRSGGKWVLAKGTVNYKAPEWLVGDDRFVNDGDEQVIEVRDHEVIGNIHANPELIQTVTP